MVILVCVNIGSGNDLLPDGTKPSPGPMLTYHQRYYSGSFTWEQFRKSTKCIRRKQALSIDRLTAVTFLHLCFVFTGAVFAICCSLSLWICHNDPVYGQGQGWLKLSQQNFLCFFFWFPPLFFSFFFLFFVNCQHTVYLMNVTFIFEMCCLRLQTFLPNCISQCGPFCSGLLCVHAFNPQAMWLLCSL